jgi:hypothetical protein
MARLGFGITRIRNQINAGSPTIGKSHRNQRKDRKNLSGLLAFRRTDEITLILENCLLIAITCLKRISRDACVEIGQKPPPDFI